jgi:multidrug resistance efflux pump
MKRSSFLYTILISALLLAACGAGTEIPASPTSLPVPQVFVAEGHLVPNGDLTLVFSVRGRVAEVLVAKGDEVKTGQVLMRLSDQDQAQAALAGAQLEKIIAQQAYDALLRTENLSLAQAWQTYIGSQQARALAQRAWEKLDLDAIQTSITNAQVQVDSKKVSLDDAQNEFNRYKNLATNEAARKIAGDNLNVAQNNYNESLRNLEEISNQRDSLRAGLDAAMAAEMETKRIYDNARTGLDPDSLAMLEARLAAADAQLNAARSILDGYELVAPMDGTIADINLEVGQQAGPETWAIILADFSQWYVDTSDLSELDVVKVEIGQQVEVTPDALPDQTMLGIVQEISNTPKSQAGDILFTVRIKLQEVDPRLRWGMTMEVVFHEK